MANVYNKFGAYNDTRHCRERGASGWCPIIDLQSCSDHNTRLINGTVDLKNLFIVVGFVCYLDLNVFFSPSRSDRLAGILNHSFSPLLDAETFS